MVQGLPQGNDSQSRVAKKKNPLSWNQINHYDDETPPLGRIPRQFNPIHSSPNPINTCKNNFVIFTCQPKSSKYFIPSNH
jgi:hypothetical protein